MEVMNQPVIWLIARVVLGILFLFQGYDKIFRLGLAAVSETTEAEWGKYNVPKWFITSSVTISSFIEMGGGLLMIIGAYKTWALYLLGLDVLMVALAFSLIRPMWDMSMYFPRLALIIFLLFLPLEWDKWSIDALLRL